MTAVKSVYRSYFDEFFFTHNYRRMKEKTDIIFNRR